MTICKKITLMNTWHILWLRCLLPFAFLIEIPEEGLGIIIEVKYAEDGDMDAGCREALIQIEDRRYEEYFYDAGVQTILKYGIACYKKRCKVVPQKVQYIL